MTKLNNLLLFLTVMAFTLPACKKDKHRNTDYFAVASPIIISSNALANNLFHQMNFGAAINAYQKAFVQLRTAEDSIHTWQQMAYAALKTNDFDQAKVWHEQTTNLLNRADSVPVILGADDLLLKGMLLERAGKWSFAIDRYQEALPLYEQACGKGHWLYLQCMSKIGLIYAERSATVDSATLILPYVLKALSLDPELKKRSAEALLANALKSVPERSHEAGLVDADSAIAICQRFDREDILLSKRCHYIIAFLLSKQAEEGKIGLEEQRNQHLQKAKEGLQVIDHFYSREMAALLLQFEDLNPAAVNRIKQSAAMWQRTDMPDFEDWLLGRCYEFDSSKLDSAIYYFEKVVARHHQDSLNTQWRLMDWTYWSLYDLYEQKKQFSQSKQYLFLNMAIGSTAAHPSPYNFVVWHNLAKNYQHKYRDSGEIADLYTAAEYYLYTDSLYFPSLPSYDESSVLRFHQQVGDQCYGDGVSVFRQLYQQDGKERHLVHAYQFMERMKSYLLYRDILLHVSPGDAGDDLNYPELKHASIELKAQLAYAELAAVHHKSVLVASKDTILSYQKSILRLDAAIDAVEEKYRQILQQPLPDLLAVRKKLANSQEAIIEYMLTQDSCYAFYIAAEKVELKVVGQKDTLLGLMNSYMTGVTVVGSDRFISPGRSLYKALIQVFEGNLSDIEHIMVIPDREMSQVPFESLVAVDGIATYAELAKSKGYAIHRFAFSYSPSIKLWWSHEKNRIDLTGSVGVWLDDNLKNKDLLLTGLRKLKLNYQLLSTGVKTKTRFLETCNQYPVLHLLVHGRSSIFNRQDNYLVLAVNGKDSVKIYGDEIRQMQLQATRLVILAACQTAVGESATGEGAFTLSRSFLQAGAQHVLASLWKAPEQSTIEIINSFYGGIQHKAGVANALYLAKLKYLALEEKELYLNHPAVWAAMIAVK